MSEIDCVKENRELIFNIISAIGLILDIIGVIWLFRLKDSYFDKLRIGFKIQKEIPFSKDAKPVDLVNSSIRKIKSEFNKMIENVTEKNKSVNKEANKAFRLIILGFLIQFLAIVLQCIY